MGEIWKDIQNYEGSYQVSNYGRVKSLSRVDSRGNKRNEKILKLDKDRQGYKNVYLCKNGKRKFYQVHRLVANAFIPNPNNYPQVNHKDENPSNNNINNLEWCTAKYNCNYGKHKEKLSLKMTGKNNHKAKSIICITTDEIFDTVAEAAKCYNLYRGQNICKCCKGKAKSAGKHPVTGEKLVWRYLNDEK